jgi:hypothetical protein
MWRASLIHFSVLIFVFSTTSSIHAREIFVVLHNESDHDWALSLNVNGSLFGGHNHWPDEPDEPTDSYQSKSGEVYHTGTWREFLVFKGTTRTIKASCDCNPFRFNAGFSDKVKGTGLIGFVGRINVLDSGKDYYLRGQNGVYRLFSSDGYVSAGMDYDLVKPLRGLWLYPSLGGNGEKIALALRKMHGVWDGTDDLENPILTLNVVDHSYSRVGCWGCGEQIELIAINQSPVRFALSSEKTYIITNTNTGYRLNYGSPPQLPPPPPAAPPEAAGGIYIVNATELPLSFQFYTPDQTALSPTISLLSSQGNGFTCLSSCKIRISTGDKHVDRDLAPGRSYMIVLDQATRLYDFRVYSQ